MHFANGCGRRGHLKTFADTDNALVVGSETGEINSERQSLLSTNHLNSSFGVLFHLGSGLGIIFWPNHKGKMPLRFDTYMGYM